MQANPTLDDTTLDAAILTRLCEWGPWTEAEVVRELGRGALDGIARLGEKGLAHRIDGGFVIASAAGRYAHDLDPANR